MINYSYKVKIVSIIVDIDGLRISLKNALIFCSKFTSICGIILSNIIIPINGTIFLIYTSSSVTKYNHMRVSE